MSHSVVLNNPNRLAWATLTVINYASGGESLAGAAAQLELDFNSVTPIIFAPCYPANNSLGVLLFPVLSGGNLLLYEMSGGAPTQIPTTNALNAVIQVLLGVTMN